MPRLPFLSQIATANASLIAGAFAVASLACLVGCTPAIGDRCTLSTDCSIQGNRVCDTSQPNGYCTVFSCSANSCPDNSACIEFGASVPGCPYDDYGAPSRVGRSICMRTCVVNSDCRSSEGYVCTRPDPTQTPWIVILDPKTPQGVCTSGGASASVVDAQVCSSARPVGVPIDAAVTLQSGGDSGDAGAADASDAHEGGPDAGNRPDDGDGSDAQGGAADSAADAFDDVRVDATIDAAADTTAIDAAVDAAVDAPGGS
jgi:hypothetical protein